MLQEAVNHNLISVFSLPLTLEWKNKNIAVKVLWFENESDASLDSNAYEIGQQLVHEHFPGRTVFANPERLHFSFL